jgi:serine/threonine protein kinase
VTTTLGACEIVCKLARGGMAELLLGRVVDRGSDQLVVLKRILPNYATNPRFVKLFVDEAKLVAMLDHPQIARVFDFGLIDGAYALVMEYVHGKDLRSTLRRTAQRHRAFPIQSAVDLAHDVATALHYAHERRQADGTLLGIVHRDVSPSNIVIAYDGAVKLVDFGVAKAASSSVKTRTGILKGKVQYMSPEQARGVSIDRRSDVFSLGIVLWEMVAGRRLFEADNDLAVIQQIVHARAPLPSTLRLDCPPELDRIIARALATEPDARYQTADALAHDLAELAGRLGPASRSLRADMQALFEPEITAWAEAQDAGLTLVDHVVATTADAMTPVSDSDIELVSVDGEDDDHDNDEATVHYTPPPREARPATLDAPPVRAPSPNPFVTELATYPSIQSDPSYATISRDRRPEPLLPPPPRTTIWVFVLAALVGAALALIASRLG